MSSSDTRQRILDVARTMFLERGYDATSLREIADEMGFTKAALYYHFKSKEDLLRELLRPFEDITNEFSARLQASVDAAAWAEVLEWIIGQLPSHMDEFRLLARNRGAIEELGLFGTPDDHRLDVMAVERAVMESALDPRQRVRMVAALAAVTGLDEWAPTLFEQTDPEVLVDELSATVRDILGLRSKRSRRAG